MPAHDNSPAAVRAQLLSNKLNQNTNLLSMKHIDHLMSREMMKLPLKVRNDIYEEIHGVRNLAKAETPESIKKALQKFKIEFNRIKTKAKHVEIHRLGGARTMNANVTVNETVKPQAVAGSTTSTNTTTTTSPTARPTTSTTPYYTETDSFRLIFLRCELFDAPKAALRYIHYLDMGCDLFGPEAALERPLDVSRDFDPNEMTSLQKGHHQLLPFRDRAGRRVFVCLADIGFSLDTRVRLKIVFYLLSKAAADIDTQRNGAILVIMPTSFASLPPSEDGSEHARVAQTNVIGCFQLMNAMPTRVTAYHMCFPNTNTSRMFAGLALFLGIGSASDRTRLKFHIGSLTEIKYKLHGYGIPIELIPVTETGRIKIKQLKEWIRLRGILDKQQQQQVVDVCGGDSGDCQQGERERDEAVRVVGERTVTVTVTPTTTDNANESSGESITSWPQQMATTTTSIVDCPGCKDVLFRSGRITMIHLGNSMFRSMCEAIFERYTCETRIGKKSIVNELIDAVESIGGRFLVWDKNGNSCWRKIGASEIRSKVGTFIRNSMSSSSNTRNKQQLMTRESDNTNNDSNNQQQQQHVVIQLKSSTYAFVKQNELKRRWCAVNVDDNSSSNNNSNNQN
mmetsp:Transcript_24060/g.52722  ORF Transcript_24060/g.52722 Transcript_24060/m.52722 type:complete len:624 (+) Transcript_24060:66-1937(+)